MNIIRNIDVKATSRHAIVEDTAVRLCSVSASVEW